MYNDLLFWHKISVTVFFLIYLVKTALLLANKNELLVKMTKVIRIPEMVISILFLSTGVMLWMETANKGTWLIIKVAMVAACIPLAVIGFKKQNKILALLSLVLIVAVYGFAEMKKAQFKKGQSLPESSATSQAVVEGKTIYETKCLMCHGSDGKLNASGATDLSVSTLDITQRIEIIKNGKGAMFAFEGQLSAQEIEAVAGYLEQLKKN